LNGFFSQLAGLVCGFIIKLHTSLHDPGFLQQLHTVGLIVQYEGLLSTYSKYCMSLFIFFLEPDVSFYFLLQQEVSQGKHICPQIHWH
jgi:hypothetical protein